MINVDADQQTDRSIIAKDVLAVNYCYAFYKLLCKNQCLLLGL